MFENDTEYSNMLKATLREKNQYGYDLILGKYKIIHGNLQRSDEKDENMKNADSFLKLLIQFFIQKKTKEVLMYVSERGYLIEKNLFWFIVQDVYSFYNPELYTGSEKIDFQEILKRGHLLYTPPDSCVWIKKDLWTVKDASLLILGIEPKTFNEMEAAYYYRKRNKEHHNFIDYFIGIEILEIGLNLREIFLEIEHSDAKKTFHFVGAANAHETLVEPYVFCKWAQGKGYTLPAKLVQWLEAVAEINPLEKWKEVIANINDIKK